MFWLRHPQCSALQLPGKEVLGRLEKLAWGWGQVYCLGVLFLGPGLWDGALPRGGNRQRLRCILAHAGLLLLHSWEEMCFCLEAERLGGHSSGVVRACAMGAEHGSSQTDSSLPSGEAQVSEQAWPISSSPSPAPPPDT